MHKAKLVNDYNVLLHVLVHVLYIYTYMRSSYQEERVGIPLTGLTLPHFNACPKPGTGFPITYVSGLFSSPGPKVHGNYCHHLASVVCKLFTFQVSSPKPLGQLEPNLAGMLLGWSSTNFMFFVPVGYSTWLPGPIICSDWLKFQRFSSLKLMN